MRALLFGLTAGVLLSALRAPLGLDLLTIPARSAGSAYGYRAAALAVVALGLLAAGRTLEGRRNLSKVVGGAASGLGLHALLVGRTPETAAGAVATALIALGVLLFLGRFAGGKTAEPQQEERDRAPLAGEATGLAIAGAGLALVCEGLARHLRLLGPGLPAEDGLAASVFVGLVLLGVVSFGRLVPAGGAAALGRAAFIAFGGLGGLIGLGVLRGLATPGSLFDYLARFGLDTSHAGMADMHALVSGAVLVAAALAVGAMLGSLDARRQMAAVLLGAAAGLVLIPNLLSVDVSADGALSASHSAALLRGGALVCLLGAALCAAFASHASKGARGAALAVAVIASVPILRLDVAEVPITRPWRERAIAPLYTLETPEGLLAIDVSDGGLEQVTLDGRELTPPTVRAALDARAIELSFALLPGEALSKEALRVLFVGQLTPGRALALERLGATVVDRTGAWHRAMPVLEQRLFRGAPSVEGRVLSLSEARGELASGVYDLVLVFAAPGEAPATKNLASPRGTTTVVWLPGASDVAARHLGEVLVATDLEELLVAVARGERRSDVALPGAPAFLPAGPRAQALSPRAWLGLQRHERDQLTRMRLGARLAGARQPPAAAARALALHFTAQRHSSPYESRARRVELDESAMEAISEAAREPGLDSLDVDLTEGLAQVLVAKRWADEVQRHLAAPAERHAPWGMLEQALAHADLEALDPAAAIERMRRLATAVPGDAETLALLAEAYYQAERHAEAAETYLAALDVAPGAHELERRLAMALVRASDPMGADLVTELLREEPEDEELRLYLDATSLPPIQRGYRPVFDPATAHQHGHDDEHGH